jgi:UDP:flavonoid glycosyltransferase YjiC (YdhE family)
MIGYRERNKSNHWKPNIELQNFVKSHKRILFITFGSMVNNAPEERAKHIIEILQRHKIPTIINSYFGGLTPPKDFSSDHIIFIKKADYSWLLPQMHAVIHHGGTGTTHMGLRGGCTTMIIPHVIDQFFWNETVSKLFVGPKGISIDKIQQPIFEEKLLDLYNNDAYQERAELISKKIHSEDLTQKLLDYINSI